MKSVNFSVGLPVNDKNKSAKLLVKHAFDQLLDDVNGKAFKLTRFNFEMPYSENDQAMIDVEYELLKKSEYSADTPKTPNVEFYKTSKAKSSVRAFKIVANTNSSNFNHKIMIEQLLSVLVKLDDITLLDMVYHDRINNDGEDRPEINVYFIC